MDQIEQNVMLVLLDILKKENLVGENVFSGARNEILDTLDWPEFFCYADDETIVREAPDHLPAADQQIFCPSCAVPGTGNTQSIPPSPALSSEPKSLADSSCQMIRGFPRKENEDGCSENPC